MGDLQTVQAVSVVQNYISTLDVKSLYERACTNHFNKAASLFLRQSKTGGAALPNAVCSSTPAVREAIRIATSGDLVPKAPAWTQALEMKSHVLPICQRNHPRRHRLRAAKARS